MQVSIGTGFNFAASFDLSRFQNCKFRFVQAYHFQKHCNCTAETHLFGQKYAVQIFVHFWNQNKLSWASWTQKMR